MDNIPPERTEKKSITSTIGEALGKDVHMRNYEKIRKSTQHFD